MGVRLMSDGFTRRVRDLCISTPRAGGLTRTSSAPWKGCGCSKISRAPARLTSLLCSSDVRARHSSRPCSLRVPTTHRCRQTLQTHPVMERSRPPLYKAARRGRKKSPSPHPNFFLLEHETLFRQESTTPTEAFFSRVRPSLACARHGEGVERGSTPLSYRAKRL